MKKYFVGSLLMVFVLASLAIAVQVATTFDSYTGVTQWNVQVTEDESGCGGGVMTGSRRVSLSHNGKSAEVGDWGHGPTKGTFSGNTLSLPARTIPDGSGTSVLSAFSVVFSGDCASFSGAYSWHYSDSYMSCDGTTSLSGTRIGSSGCTTSSPTPTPTPTPSPTPQAPTPTATPAPTPRACSPVPPPCPAISGTELRNPGIASGSLCRGACGPDCPSSCTTQRDRNACVSDGEGCFYVCSYSIQQCGTASGCRKHDACYDSCAAKGENSMCYLGGFCHCSCDLGCVADTGLAGLVNCPLWAFGYGPTDSVITYSSPIAQSGPFQSCPLG